jgi:hypothetical protein
MLDSACSTDNNGPGSDLDCFEMFPLNLWQQTDKFMVIETYPEALDGGQHRQQLPLDQEMQEDYTYSEINAELDEKINAETPSDIDLENNIPFGHFIEYHPTLNGIWFWTELSLNI